MTAQTARRADRVILAYGALPPRMQEIADRLVELLRRDGITLYAMALTKGGNPRHPLYLKKGTEPFLFQPSRAAA